jgi:hypothetical protein
MANIRYGRGKSQCVAKKPECVRCFSAYHNKEPTLLKRDELAGVHEEIRGHQMAGRIRSFREILNHQAILNKNVKGFCRS